MEVAHSEDHVKQAIVGKAESINFGISDDPAFFQILSSSLYKNPKLAMVRETICNAWDAHIMVGKEDTSINVSLSDKELVIQDFGPGIPQDLIGPIFGVYGASTKKRDSRQTGGFGLGCKSPFAYTDSFQVVSCHMGTKSIYIMSKSSAEVGGKPSIVTVWSGECPEDETGITVTIPIKEFDTNTMIRNILHTVKLGDIKAKLDLPDSFSNHVLKDTPSLALEESEFNFVLVPFNNVLTQLMPATNSGVYVRYGNVIYPVDSNEKYEEYLNFATSFSASRNVAIVLKSNPDSLSIAPSRENLTYSELTVETVHSLLLDFLLNQTRNPALVNKISEYIQERINTLAADERPLNLKLIKQFGEIPGLQFERPDSLIKTMEGLLKLEATQRKIKGKGNFISTKRRFKEAFDYMVKVHSANPESFDLGKLQMWYRSFKKMGVHVIHGSIFYESFHKYSREISIAKRLNYKMAIEPMLKTLQGYVGESLKLDDLYIYTSSTLSSTYSGYITSGCELSKARDYNSVDVAGTLRGLLKPTIVVTDRIGTIKNRINSSEGKDHFAATCSPGTEGFYFVVLAPTKATEQKEFMDKIQKYIDDGGHVVDMCKRLPTEQARYELARQRAEERRKAKIGDTIPSANGRVSVKKKAGKGLIQFSEIKDSRGTFDSIVFSELAEPIRNENPEFIVHISTSQNSRKAANDHSAVFTQYMLDNFGTKGVVTNNVATFKKYTEEGVPHMGAYAIKVIKDFISTNESDFKKALEFSKKPLKLAVGEKVRGFESYHFDGDELFDFYRDSGSFFGLIPNVTKPTSESLVILALADLAESELSYYDREALVDVLKDIKSDVEPNKELVEELGKRCKNPNIQLLDWDATNSALRDDDGTLESKIHEVIEILIK